MIKAGIIGAAGYAGGELIRILNAHPQVKIETLFSRSQAGKAIADVHTDLFFQDDMIFNDKISPDLDIAFMCMGHGASKAFLADEPFSPKTKIVDLSHDFRIKTPEHAFVYGLPELNKERIVASSFIANPGCFATTIQLALLPLAHASILSQHIHIHAITGSTGAGQSLKSTSHFSWRASNVSVYKAFAHQHEAEIVQSLKQLQSRVDPKLHFVPVRGNFTRGILASIYLECSRSEAEIQRLFDSYYQHHPFVRRTEHNPDLKQVINTNYNLIYLKKHGDQLHIISLIDNLIKGASGQAVQNMNLQFGLLEDTGLQLKGIGF